MADDRILPLVIALTLTAFPGEVAAQEWRQLPSSEAGTTAAGVRWDNGTGAVARCREGRYQLLFTLRTPVAGETIPVRAAEAPGGDAHPNPWRMTPQGNATFARLPVRMSEAWLRGRTHYLTFPEHDEQALPPPGGEAALRGVLADCGHDIDVGVPETPIMITNPNWRSQPDAWILRRYYPLGAARQGVGGRVVLNCVVNAVGELEDCITVEETPPNAGFGPAAIALSTEFRMHPRMENGVPVGESTVLIPIEWGMDPRFER